MHTEGMLGSNVPGYVDTPNRVRILRQGQLHPARGVGAALLQPQALHEFDHGGHFAALERPDDLVTEIREFFRPLRA